MERPLMRKINLKVLLAVLAGTALLTGVVFGVHYLQRKRIATALLWQARKAEETGQLDRNILYLGRYLEFQPDDLEEKAHLGKVLLSEAANSPQGSRARAVDLLDEVLRQQPERLVERRMLVKGALTIPNASRSKQARESLMLLLDPSKPVPASLTGEDLGELEGYWAALFEQEGNFAEAISWCRKATRNRPSEQINYLRLAALLRRQSTSTQQEKEANAADANQAMNALVENNHTSAQALLARWRYRREFDLVEIQGAPRRADRVAFEDAITDVQNAVKAAPENLDALLASADVKRLQNDRKAARENLRLALDVLGKQGRVSPNDAHVQQVHWQLANLLLDNALIDRDKPAVRDPAIAEAIPSIEILRKTRGMPAAADYLEGRVNFQRGKWQDAIFVFERARPLLNDKRDLLAQIDLFLGQCYEKVEEPVRMYKCYERLSVYDPSSVPAQIGMASALWMQGRLDEAKRIYDRVMSSDNAPAAGLIDVARLELARQLQREPGKRDWNRAETVLKLADEKMPRDFDVALLRVELLAAKEKYTEAEELLTRAIQVKPKREVDLWVLRADLARRQKQPDRAREILDQAVEAKGDGPALRLERVQVALSGTPAEGLEAVKKAEEGLDKLSVEEQSQLLEGLAGAYFRLSNLPEARRLTGLLAKNSLHKNDLKLQLLLLDLALRSDDSSGASQVLETLKTMEQGTGPFTRYGLAIKSLATARKLETNDKNREAALEEAKRQLDQVARVRQGWSPVRTARAEVYELQGNLDQAADELRRAMEEGDNSPAVLQRLVRALIARQRDPEADEELKKLQGMLQATSENRKIAAIVAARRGDMEQLYKLVQEEAALNSTDPRDMLWIGKMLAAAGKVEQAETTLRKAIAATPKDPEPWIALVQLLASNRRDKDAAATLTEAEEKVDPKRKSILLALGLEAVGKIQDALPHIQEAEKGEPDNMAVLRHAVRFYLRLGRLDLAEVTLRRVLQGKVTKATGEDRDWARRGLALTLANGTDFTRFREALELVGLPLDEKGRLPKDNAGKGENVELVRTRARVLATQAQLSYRGRAIALFERLDQGGSLNDDDKLMLALLHERTGAWPKARDQYEQLALKPGLGPQPLVQLIMGHLREKEPNTAEPYLAKLEQLEKDRGVAPGAFGSLELRARFLEEKGDVNRAFEMLKTHVERKDAPPEDRLVLVAFCARHKRAEQGLAICKEARATCRPEAISGATVALLRAVQAGDDQCKETQKWLEGLIAENPRKVVLRMHLANLYDFRGQYREAEAEYREILKPENEPNNIVALNNLAWLLSLQIGRNEEALDIVTRAINSAGRRPELLDTRGVILFQLARNEEAIADLKEVAADAPSALRLFHLARAYQAVRDRVNATQALRKAKEMGLQTESMHPVEQEACKKLLSDLKL
jgi:tetratricopeptide (TPR) repeat protein